MCSLVAAAHVSPVFLGRAPGAVCVMEMMALCKQWLPFLTGALSHIFRRTGPHKPMKTKQSLVNRRSQAHQDGL